jgi:PAS domain S-box-containing protein
MSTSIVNDFHESEEGYRLLFQSNPLPMWIYDRETLAFLAVNNAAVQHYGYSREEFLRMTLKEIRQPEDIPWLLEQVAQIKPGLNSALARHLNKDGILMSIEIVSHTLQFAGRQAELVLAMDVTSARTHRHWSEEANRAPEVTEDPSLECAFADDELTMAEIRIASSIARGFSNRQIAASFGLSVRTVENHVSHILAKKKFLNRVEIARHVLRSHQLNQP